MNDGTKRTIVRWIHLILSIPIIGYVYSPFEELPNYAPVFGLSPFLSWYFPASGCGKATSSGDSF